MKKNLLTISLLSLLTLSLSSCIGTDTKNNKPIVSAQEDQKAQMVANLSEQVLQEVQKGVVIPKQYAFEPNEKILNEFSVYNDTLKSAKKLLDDQNVLQFISTGVNAMTENVFLAYVTKAAYENDWSRFEAAMQYAPQFGDIPNQDYKCAKDLYRITTTKSVSVLARELADSREKLSPVCNRLIAVSSHTGQVSKDQAMRRILILISNNQIDDANDLASRIGISLTPNAPQNADPTLDHFQRDVALIQSIITPRGRNRSDAQNYLQSVEASLMPLTKQFAYVVLGYSSARDLNMDNALYLYSMSDPSMLSEDQFDWYARAALRKSDFNKLAHIISLMPTKLQNSPTWTYWHARAIQGTNPSLASQLFQQAASSGRNFYAVLAQEALGKTIVVQNNNPKYQQQELSRVENDGAIHRAIVLFHESLNQGDRKMRTAAQQQWRFAVRDFNERTQLAAALVALKDQFYEMAIYSADKPNVLLDYNVRYLSPFRDKVTYWANQHQIDPAWVYGLMRQESRFMTVAASSVGASGLMQIMPGTARLIARKMGIGSYQINDLDTNIKMGTWYLSYVRNNLGDDIMATAGYNAGPRRAIKWQAYVPLEGAIYAETIPFNETRDYVKKVMTNTTYYAHLFGERNYSLKSRLGTIPAFSSDENSRDLF